MQNPPLIFWHSDTFDASIHWLEVSRVHIGMKGGFLVEHPTAVTNCAPHKDRGELCFRFSDSRGFPHECHFLHEGIIHVILHEGHSCPKLQNPPLMRMDSATPPSGGAQNDSMVGDVQGTFQNEGRVQSSLYFDQLLSNKS